MTTLARRLALGAVLLAAMGVCAAYGYLLRQWNLFPSSILFRHHGVPVSAPAAVPTRTLSKSPIVNAETEEHRVAQGEMAAPKGSGVVTYDPLRAENGLNFFTSANAPFATLMDMKGAIVRTWMADAGEIFAGKPRLSGVQRGGGFIRDAELLPDGGILALFDDSGIVRLDARSRVIWSFPARVHHDLYLDATGTIWALTHEERLVPDFRRGPVLDGVVLSLSADGRLLSRISVLDCFRKSSYAPLLAAQRADSEDPFQIQSVIVLDGTHADRSPIFRRGNLLISSRNLGLIAVIDPELRSVVWALTGLWQSPQSARLLSAGHLLVFDGLDRARGAPPRVLEVDPFSQQLVWSFGASPGSEMLAKTGAWVERLPGGNTLITETDAGRVREVTRDRRVVWEFVNPHRVGQKQKGVANIYCMERVSRDLPFLREGSENTFGPDGDAKTAP